MASDLRFHWSDYLVFVLSIVLSGAVGVIQGIVDQAQKRKNGSEGKKVDENKTVDRGISVWPASLSVMASTLAAPFVLGVPAEIYAYGTQFVYMIFGLMIGVPFVTHIFFSRFYKLEIASIYEYLEFRFNKTVRSLCSAIFALSIIIYIGIITYAPAVAFSQVTGLSMEISVLGVGLIGIVYTAVGGLKGVIWVDAIQMLIILASLLAIIIKGSIDVGGISQVFKLASDGGRLEAPVMSLNPMTRHSFWTQAIGGALTTMVIFTNQAIVQKFLGLGTIKQMYITSYVSMAASSTYFLLFSFSGLVIYAYYATCSPLLTGKIKSMDQLVPVFVLETFQGYYGIAGLFTSAVFSASLSTLAGGINALAAVTILDIINPVYVKRTGRKQIDPKKLFFVFKGLVIMYGLITIGFAYLAPFLGTGLMQIALNLMGVVGAPMLALFISGVLLPCVNSIGASVGLVSSLILMLWISTGGIFMAGKYKRHISLRLPFSNSSCPSGLLSSSNNNWTTDQTNGQFDWTSSLFNISEQFNLTDHWSEQSNVTLDGSNITTNMLEWVTQTTSSTIDWLTTFQHSSNDSLAQFSILRPEPGGIEKLYMISYMWYSVLSIALSIIIALLVSWCTGFRRGMPVDPDLSYLCWYHREEQLTEKNEYPEKVGPVVNAAFEMEEKEAPPTAAEKPDPVADQFGEYDDVGVYNYGIFTRNRCSRCRKSKIMYCTRL